MIQSKIAALLLVVGALAPGNDSEAGATHIATNSSSLGGSLNGYGRPKSSRDVTIQGAKSEEEDFALAPAGVTDLRVQALTDSSVVLQWTEVRSSTTAIPRYVVRYDSLGRFLWNTEQDVTTGGCAAPIVGANAAGGRLHACVLGGLLPNIAYEFQIAAYTGALNSTAVFGPLSNVVWQATAERIGPMLVLRPRIADDSFAVHSAWISAYRDTFPLSGWFRYGGYQTAAFGANGVVTARGYLLITKP